MSKRSIMWCGRTQDWWKEATQSPVLFFNFKSIYNIKEMTKQNVKEIAAKKGYDAQYSGKTGEWFFHKNTMLNMKDVKEKFWNLLIYAYETSTI